MPKHTPKLLVLLMVFSVAPASAGSRAVAVTAYDGIECPYERARLAAAAAENAEPTTVTLTQAVPGIGPRSALLAP